MSRGAAGKPVAATLRDRHPGFGQTGEAPANSVPQKAQKAMVSPLPVVFGTKRAD